MRVTLTGTGTLRQLVGRTPMTLDLPDGAGVRTALDAARERLGDAAGRLVGDSGGLRSGVLLFVNQEMVRGGNDDVHLSDGDELILVPAVSGGAPAAGSRCWCADCSSSSPPQPRSGAIPSRPQRLVSASSTLTRRAATAPAEPLPRRTERRGCYGKRPSSIRRPAPRRRHASLQRERARPLDG